MFVTRDEMFVTRDEMFVTTTYVGIVLYLECTNLNVRNGNVVLSSH